MTRTRDVDFSLMLGGPLYQLYLRTQLARPPLDLLHRRVVFFTVLIWVPLLILSLWDGTTFGGVSLPFIHDIATHARLLIAVPLFLIAERVVHLRLQPIVGQFLAREIVPTTEESAFQHIIASAQRWRDSLSFELILMVLCFAGGHVLWMQTLGSSSTTWIGVPQLTAAGKWYSWVSMPVFQFMLLRWYYRFFIWARMLWQISRLKLHLLATHPDRAGGLGFLSWIPLAFGLLIVAQGAVLAGIIAGKIFFSGASLLDFKMELASMVFFQLIVVLGPLCVFLPALERARRQGYWDYGTLAMHYMHAFDHKWNRAQVDVGEKLLGSGDVQSLADMGNSYSVVQDMQILPIGKQTVLQVIGLTLLPVLPLILTVIPLDQLVGKILAITF